MTDTRDAPLHGMPHNPTHTTHALRLPRTCDDMLRFLMSEFRRFWDMSWDDNRPKSEQRQAASLVVNFYGQVHLLAALRETAPEQADKVAASLADAWDAGDSLGVWVHQWSVELDNGQPLTLFFAGEDTNQ